MTGAATERARDVMEMAVRGALGEAGRDLAALMMETAKRGRAESAEAKRQADRVAELDALVWALAHVVADIMDGTGPDAVVDDMPAEARRRVIMVRHRRSKLAGLPVRDASGQPMPEPPSRPSVMRDRIRIIDMGDV